ncbi:MAG: hypothetical protein ACR2N7_09105 [Acidimicrobiia bacterium]
MSGILDDIDELYEGCVMAPGRWNSQAFADWSEAVAATNELDKQQAKYVRRAITAARKLRDFWMDRTGAAPDDWRSRVDVAMGPRAWRPQLDLAEQLLVTSPSPEAFDRVSTLFPLVMNEPYLDGITYDDWVAE